MNAKKRIFSARAFAKEKVVATVAFSAFNYVDGNANQYVDGSGNIYVSGSGTGDAFFLKATAKKVNFTLRGWNNNG